MHIARYTAQPIPDAPGTWRVVDQRTGNTVAERRAGGAAVCEQLAKADAHERSMVLA